MTRSERFSLLNASDNVVPAAPGAVSEASTAGQAVRAGTTGWYRPNTTERVTRMALCGSRSPGSDDDVIDKTVVALGRLLMNSRFDVAHGPRGVGMKVMTYIADHFRPPTLQTAVGIFGRQNVIRDVEFVLVVGGSSGTVDEVDLAISMGKRLIPFGASGGAAGEALTRLAADHGLRAWLSQEQFEALLGCTAADQYAALVEQFVSAEVGSAARE